MQSILCNFLYKHAVSCTPCTSCIVEALSIASNQCNIMFTPIHSTLVLHELGSVIEFPTPYCLALLVASVGSDGTVQETVSTLQALPCRAACLFLLLRCLLKSCLRLSNTDAVCDLMQSWDMLYTPSSWVGTALCTGERHQRHQCRKKHHVCTC